jgi:predicted Mrr-cat superfamily restriction endonuclease
VFFGEVFMEKNIWVIRPEPNFTDRLEAFISKGMVAIGWPAVGDLGGGLDRFALAQRLLKTYVHYSGDQKTELPVAVGVLDRFVNQISAGDVVLVPHDKVVYLAEVIGPYEYHPELSEDRPDAGYPHWHRVSYLNGGQPYCKVSDLPLGVRRSVDCRLSVFSIHSAAKAMWGFLGESEQ